MFAYHQAAANFGMFQGNRRAHPVRAMETLALKCVLQT